MYRVLGVVGREIKGMHEAAYLLAAFALLSQVLGLLRDRLLAADFGASHTLDLYYAAFRMPDFLFATVASLLSLYALLPVLSRLEERSQGSAVGFLRQELFVFFVGMGAVSLGAFILAPVLVLLIAPGLSSPELIMLARILLLQPILLGASNVVASLTQMRHQFFLYSISPLLYNLGIICGIVFFYPYFGLAGLAWGVVLGAALHLAVQLPFFIREEYVPLRLSETLRDMYEVLVLSIPRTLALAAGQLSLLVLVALASLLAVGSISVFMFAWNLQSVPLAIIGVSYSVAAFPTLSRLFAAGAHSEFAQHVEGALRHILFWAVPATVFVVVLRAQLVRVILGAGAFDWSATRLVAAALAMLILSLAAQSVSLLIARGYYAAGNTHKPFYFGLLDLCVSVCSALLFLKLYELSPAVQEFFQQLLRVDDVAGASVLMLALGLAFGSVVRGGVGLFFFVRDFSIETAGLLRVFWQSLFAALVGGTVSYQTLAFVGGYFNINTLPGVLGEGILAGILGLVVSVVVLALLKNRELLETYDALRRRFRDAPPVVLEPTDISS